MSVAPVGLRRTEASRPVTAQNVEPLARPLTGPADSFESNAAAYARRKASQSVEAPAATPTVYRALKRGAEGEDVKVLQQKLKEAGYDVDVNGTYDAKTEAAVTQLQTDHNLDIDGVAGTQTYEALGIPYVKGGKPPAAPEQVDGPRPNETATDYDQRLRHEAADRLVKIVPPSHATEEDRQVVVAELEKLPLEDLKKLEKNKVRVVVAHDSVADYRPDLKDETPPGWTSGTYKTCAGAYCADKPPNKDLVIATVPGPDGRRAIPAKDSHGDEQHAIAGSTSANVVIHEATHAVDAASGRPSDKKEFDAAFDADRDRPGSSMDGYWNQPGNEKAGRHEAYAESLAMYRDDPERLKREFPAIYAYWEKRLGK